MSEEHVSVAGDFIGNDPITASAQDRFGRQPFAARIAATILKRRDPASLVIGLYGAWGTGKSSVLNLLEDELRHYRHVGTGDEVVVVRFNPWLSWLPWSSVPDAAPFHLRYAAGCPT